MVVTFTQNAKTDFTHCSFCGTADNENRILITGMDGAICENCIADAKETLLKNVGVLDPIFSQQLKLKKTMNKSFILITIMLVVAIALISFKKYF
jgi:hypothetical protein